MDLQTLSFFRMACEGMNVTAIAEAQHISRQAVSQCIARLEEECGSVLFTRHHRGLKMTTEGELLYRHVLVMLDNWSDALQELDSYRRRPVQHLRIGYGQMTYNLWPSHHIAEFNASHPELIVEHNIDVPDNLYRDLKNGKYDGIVTNTRDTSDNLRGQRILQRPAIIIASEDDFPDRPAELTAKQLSGLCLISLPGNRRFNIEMMTYLRRHDAHCPTVPASTTEITGLLRELSDSTHCFYVSSGVFTSYIILPRGLFTARLVGSDEGAVPNKDVYLISSIRSPLRQGLDEYASFLMHQV